jgi:hypothetical protein
MELVRTTRESRNRARADLSDEVSVGEGSRIGRQGMRDGDGMVHPFLNERGVCQLSRATVSVARGVEVVGETE